MLPIQQLQRPEAKAYGVACMQSGKFCHDQLDESHPVFGLHFWR